MQPLQFESTYQRLQPGFPGQDGSVDGITAGWQNVPFGQNTTQQLFDGAAWWVDSGVRSNANASRVDMPFTYTINWQAFNNNVIRVIGSIQIHAPVRTVNTFTSNPFNVILSIGPQQHANWHFQTNTWTNIWGVVPGWPGFVGWNFQVDIPPQQQTTTLGVIYVFNDAVTSQYDDEYRIGVLFRNTLPNDYRPGSRYIVDSSPLLPGGSGEVSCDRSTRSTMLNAPSGTTTPWWAQGMNSRMAPPETELRTQNGGTGTGNPPSIQLAVGERNQHLIGSFQEWGTYGNV